MTHLQLISDPSQVPDACTLPTAEQPIRVSEFDELFGLATGAARPSPTTLKLRLPAEPEVAAQAASLAAREARCCSFFTFTLTVESTELQLSVEAPTGHIDVLDVIEQWVEDAVSR